MNVIDLLAIIAVPAIVLVAALCCAASVMGRLRRQHREDMAAFDRQAEALLKTFHDRGPIQAGAITAGVIDAGAISVGRIAPGAIHPVRAGDIRPETIRDLPLMVRALPLADLNAEAKRARSLLRRVLRLIAFPPA